MGTMENDVKKFTKPKEEWNVWRLVSHLSSALDYLHDRSPQILHHDLKPDNILGVTGWEKLEKGNRTFWKIADFGVAKLLTREAQENYYGDDGPGVPTYMGPEVIRNFENYTAASDVWSLGCVVAFYMKIGKHVFNCNNDVLNYNSEGPLTQSSTRRARTTTPWISYSSSKL